MTLAGRAACGKDKRTSTESLYSKFATPILLLEHLMIKEARPRPTPVGPSLSPNRARCSHFSPRQQMIDKDDVCMYVFNKADVIEFEAKYSSKRKDQGNACHASPTSIFVYSYSTKPQESYSKLPVNPTQNYA